MNYVSLKNCASMKVEEKIVEILTEKKWHIACAESCTGGLVASRLIDVAGVSNVLNLSIITYANDAKTKFLNVSPNTIKKHGVVSEEVTREMAKGIAKLAASEVGIATSGIAGPGGGTKFKPVGMVCFGLFIKDKVYTYTKYFSNLSRNEVRQAAVEFVLNKLFELIGF